jgi:hypothetical protein
MVVLKNGRWTYPVGAEKNITKAVDPQSILETALGCGMGELAWCRRPPGSWS